MPGVDRSLPQQWANDPVFVGDWLPDEDAPIHPVGQKPKRVFICPESVRQPYLIRGQRYLFKEGDGFRAQQLWSEVIAYQLSRATGTDVPPAFVAIDQKRGREGVLIEFFYGQPGEFPPLRLVPAIERMQGLGIPVNLRRGSLNDNLNLCRRHRVPHRAAWWGETVAFDALIGNNDRHTENWGFLRQTADPSAPEFRLAPVFDNGSSLGWQIGESQLAKFSSLGRLKQFVEQGAPHYGWFPGDNSKVSHSDLCAKLIEKHPEARAAMQRVIGLRDSDIQDTLHWSMSFRLDIPFSAARADFVRSLLEARRAAIAAAIEV